MNYTGSVDSSGGIGSELSVPNPVATEAAAFGRGKGAVHAPAAENAADSANLSVAGAMLSQAVQGDDVRADRVAAVRQAIGAGNYNVSSENVAGRLIATMQQ